MAHLLLESRTVLLSDPVNKIVDTITQLNGILDLIAISILRIY